MNIRINDVHHSGRNYIVNGNVIFFVLNRPLWCRLPFHRPIASPQIRKQVKHWTGFWKSCPGRWFQPTFPSICRPSGTICHTISRWQRARLLFRRIGNWLIVTCRFLLLFESYFLALPWSNNANFVSIEIVVRLQPDRMHDWYLARVSLWGSLWEGG